MTATKGNAMLVRRGVAYERGLTSGEAFSVYPEPMYGLQDGEYFVAVVRLNADGSPPDELVERVARGMYAVTITDAFDEVRAAAWDNPDATVRTYDHGLDEFTEVYLDRDSYRWNARRALRAALSGDPPTTSEGTDNG